MTQTNWNNGVHLRKTTPFITATAQNLQEPEYIDIDSISKKVRWTPETGASEIAGVLEKIEMVENCGKPFPIYFIRSLDGVVYSITGYTVLRQKMEGIMTGTRLKILYLGEIEKSGALMFKVLLHPDDLKV